MNDVKLNKYGMVLVGEKTDLKVIIAAKDFCSAYDYLKNMAGGMDYSVTLAFDNARYIKTFPVDESYWTTCDSPVLVQKYVSRGDSVEKVIDTEAYLQNMELEVALDKLNAIALKQLEIELPVFIVTVVGESHNLVVDIAAKDEFEAVDYLGLICDEEPLSEILEYNDYVNIKRTDFIERSIDDSPKRVGDIVLIEHTTNSY